MKARKNQKNDLQSSLLMLQEARNQRGNDVATEDEITQHDRALRSGQHHSVRNVHLNQLIADIEGKKEELTNLNLRDSDLLGVERKAGRGDGGRALQLKDNG